VQVLTLTNRQDDSVCLNSRRKKIKYDNRMTPPQPITVSASVLAQMFLYLDSPQVDIDAFLRALGIEPETVRSPDAYLPVKTTCASRTRPPNTSTTRILVCTWANLPNPAVGPSWAI